MKERAMNDNEQVTVSIPVLEEVSRECVIIVTVDKAYYEEVIQTRDFDIYDVIWDHPNYDVKPVLEFQEEVEYELSSYGEIEVIS